MTTGQLAGIRKLNLGISADDYDCEYMRRFRTGDFNGLTGVTELDMTNQSSFDRRGPWVAGAPETFRRQLKKFVHQDADRWKIENADHFRGMTNLEILWLGTNNMVYGYRGTRTGPRGRPSAATSTPRSGGRAGSSSTSGSAAEGERQRPLTEPRKPALRLQGSRNSVLESAGRREAGPEAGQFAGLVSPRACAPASPVA